MLDLNRRLLLFFYPLLLIVAYLQARGMMPPPYQPFNGLVTIPFSLVIIYLGVVYYAKNSRNIPVLGYYFAFTVFTVVSYIFNGRPFVLYVQELAYVLLTMLVAYMAVDQNIDKGKKFYKYLFFSWLICFIIGYYLYFVRPEWYANAIVEKHSESSWENQALSADQVLEQFRFSSFTLDSYSISFMSMYLFPLGIYYSINAKTKKLMYVIATLIVFVSALLSMQRAAIMCVLVDVVILYFIGEKGTKKVMACVMIAFAVLLIVLGGSVLFSDINEKLFERFSTDSMDDAMNGSRLNQIKNAFAELMNPVTGQGAGSLGGRSRGLGLKGVSDCCWARLFCEQGLIGFSLFTLLMIKTLKRAFKNKKLFFVEICGISNILIAMLVSDPLFYQFYTIPFWFMVGMVWNKNAFGVNFLNKQTKKII